MFLSFPFFTVISFQFPPISCRFSSIFLPFPVISRHFLSFPFIFVSLCLIFLSFPISFRVTSFHFLSFPLESLSSARPARGAPGARRMHEIVKNQMKWHFWLISFHFPFIFFLSCLFFHFPFVSYLSCDFLSISSISCRFSSVFFRVLFFSFRFPFICVPTPSISFDFLSFPVISFHFFLFSYIFVSFPSISFHFLPFLSGKTNVIHGSPTSCYLGQSYHAT